MTKLVIDANHLAGRCRAVMGELCTSKGERSGVIMGFLKSLLWAKREAGCDLDDVLVCWDSGRSAYRMQIYPDYKGNRGPKEPTEEDIYEHQQYVNQLVALGSVLRHLGCKQVRVKEMEADDLCSIFAFHFSKWDSVLVHSGDKDFHQLVSPRISIFDPKAGVQNERAIFDRWGLPSTEQILWYRIMTGDQSDNISGVGGIGEVWAKRLLSVAKIEGDKIFFESEDPKLQNKITLVNSRKDILTRNYKLMRLPRIWEESFCSPEQQIDAMIQVLNSGKESNEIQAMRFLKEWELESVIEVFGRF